MNLDIEIPLNPPGINSTYRIGKKHLYKSSESKTWSDSASQIIKNAANLIGWEHKEGNLYKVYISFTNLRMDVDGPIKLVLDTLAQSLDFNDKIIQQVCIEKLKSEEPMTKIELRNYAE